jgi:hypothetical protein
VSAASGAGFSGDHGNPATGFSDPDGIPYARRGSDDTTLQGAFDLSGIPLPPGISTATAALPITIEQYP